LAGETVKILLLTQVLPYPPDSGPKVKTWNLLKFLAQRHEVTLVSFVRGDQSQEVKLLERYCSGGVYTTAMERSAFLDGMAMLRSLATGRPWMMVRDERPPMQRLVERLAAQRGFDIAHADQLNMAQYAARVPGARKVLDAHNALWLLYNRLWATMSLGPKKWLLGRDWRLIKRYEGQVCREFDAVLAVSAEDKAALQEAAELPVEITVIPITVDTDEVQQVQRAPGAGHILHIGTMFWPPNIDGIRWFINDVYPLIRERRPKVVFDVLGARPPRDLLDLNTKGIGVNVTGYVDNPAPYLEQAGVMVVPLRAGGGMRVKILNALAQGLPLVSTTIGSEGIAVESGRHLLIADRPEDFARATLRLLEDQELASAMGRRGRELIVDSYDYRAACQPLDAIYTGAPAQPASAFAS
jgi:glycosyltransferase involved in cell wall biosynthesis